MQKFPLLPKTRLTITRKVFSAKRGFTLIEMLVVIAIIALLISLVVPAVNNALEQARSTACMMKVREMGTALQLYAVDHRGYKPAPRRDDQYSGQWYFALGGGRAEPLEDGYLPNPRRSPVGSRGGFWHCPSFRLPMTAQVHYGMNRAHGFDRPMRLENTTPFLSYNLNDPVPQGRPVRNPSAVWVFGCGIVSSLNMARRSQPPVHGESYPNPNNGHFYVWHRRGSPFVHLDGSVRMYSLDFLRASSGAGPTGVAEHDAFWGHAYD